MTLGIFSMDHFANVKKSGWSHIKQVLLEMYF